MARLRSTAAAAGCPDLIEFRDFTPHEQLGDELRQAQVFAAPSHFEGGPGLVYLEAMACGLPVVACSGSGSDEVMTSEEDAILVPPFDTAALRGALERVLGDATLRHTLGARAHQRVLAEADSERCLDRLHDFLVTRSANREAS